MYNLSHNVDHDETKKMLMKIGQFNDYSMNHDLDHELDPNKISKTTMTVEEEFKERVRRAKKKEKERTSTTDNDSHTYLACTDRA